MSTTFSHAVSLQGRVLWALMLREIQVVHDRTKLGYLWELIKSAFGVTVFWLIRSVMGMTDTNGLHILIFLVLGFIPLHMFTDVLIKGIKTIKTNSSLLTFPQITPLDLHLSFTLVKTVSQLLILALFLAGSAVAKIEYRLVDPLAFGLGLFGLFLFSWGTSLTITALNLYVPLIKEVIPMCTRVLFFTSGIFFSPVKLSQRVGDWVMWNPLANYIELLRGSFLYTTPSEFIKMEFMISVTVLALGLGLLLERYTRKKAASE